MSTSANRLMAVGTVWVLGAAGLLANTVQAQTVFRAVGADGKVTYSDKAPASSVGSTVSTGLGGKTGGVQTAGLPYELAQAAGKFPVTLYSSDDCLPCSSGRVFLASRGIPFAEKSVMTVEDAQALQRLSGNSTLPFLTIGSQQLKGYSDVEWAQFLDAAGYPKTSTLPKGYRQSAATPLVAVAAAGEAAPGARAAVRPAAYPAPAAAPAPAENNPAGIRF